MRRFRPGLRRHGVTEQQWRVLRALAHAGPLEITELASATFLLPPSLSRILPDMETRALIRRTQADADLRRSVISLRAERAALDRDARAVFRRDLRRDRAHLRRQGDWRSCSRCCANSRKSCRSGRSSVPRRVRRRKNARAVAGPPRDEPLLRAEAALPAQSRPRRAQALRGGSRGAARRVRAHRRGAYGAFESGHRLALRHGREWPDPHALRGVCSAQHGTCTSTRCAKACASTDPFAPGSTAC